MAKKMKRSPVRVPKDKDSWRNKDFLNMCHWIEKELFNYDDNQKLQKAACLRLQGLKKGKIIANNKIADNGNYTVECVFNTFKADKEKILKALKYKTFKNETTKMAYICAIVRGDINDMYTRMKNVEVAKSKQESINIDAQNSDPVEYHSQTESNTENQTFEDIW